MAYKNNILLGRIIKVIGYGGAVAVRLERIFSENIPPLKSVFLEIEGRPVPFFVSGMEYSGTDILKLKFENYDSSEKINEFIGCRIFLTDDELSNKNQSTEKQELTGFRVFAERKRLLGSVSEVAFNNGQWLLVVTSAEKKKIYIPFHEHFIEKLDKRKKVIFMNIPDGLVEINRK